MPLLLIGYKSAAVLSMISPIHFVLHSQDYGGTGGFVQGDQRGGHASIFGGRRFCAIFNFLILLLFIYFVLWKCVGFVI